MGSLLSRLENLTGSDHVGKEQESDDSGKGTTPVRVNGAFSNELVLDRSVNGDPRSPGTSDLIRTPIAVITDSKISQQPFDPRSPSAGVIRTPLCPAASTSSTGSKTEVAISDRDVIDPRSPTCESDRTPILADCDVHRTWEFDDTDVDADSMYVNSPSFAVGELDLSSDDQSSNSCGRGSMENLLHSSSTSTDLVSPDVAAQIEGQDESGKENRNAETEVNVSPIGSPVKPSPTQDQTVAPSTLCSTPNVKTPSRHPARGLTNRDTNSPRSIIQRRQINKLHNKITSDGKLTKHTIADKENMSVSN